MTEEINNHILKENLDYALSTALWIIDKHDTNMNPKSTNQTLDTIYKIHDKLRRIEMHIERKNKK